jgi:hypothetical protein
MINECHMPSFQVSRQQKYSYILNKKRVGFSTKDMFTHLLFDCFYILSVPLKEASFGNKKPAHGYAGRQEQNNEEN